VFAERFIVKAASYVLSDRTAYRIARAALASRGISWAGPASGIRGSGELAFLRRNLPKIPKPCVFDVGANIGEYSRAVLKANSTAVLHCFEPSKAHFDILQSTLPNSPDLHLHHCGLSDMSESRVLYKDAEVSGLASLNQRDLCHIDVRLNLTETVNLITGDAYVSQRQIRAIDLIKIDVEGWEMSVLRGFKECFDRKVIKCCQFEFGHAHLERRENFRDFYRFFTERDFTIGALLPNGRVNYMHKYDEIFENYYATNYVATVSSLISGLGLR